MDASATDATPGTAAILSMIAWCIRSDRRFLLDLRAWNRQPQRLHFVGPHESRVHVSQRLERPDHQPRADEKHERQRDLRDDERVARAMAFPARARGPPAAAKRGAELARPRT